MATTDEPKLDAPGAGLPAPELFFARLMFARKRRSGTRQRFNETFSAERARIRRLLEASAVSQRPRRVLINRLRGLEDSSRHWSVWMTVDHLRITNEVFSQVIASLSRGHVPPGRASTADVKPSPNVGLEVEDAFEKSCDGLLASVAASPNLETKKRYAHPWFGPLDAAGWHALAALHMTIHRRQIEKILAGMATSTP